MDQKTLPLYLSFQLFLHRWGENDGELWACIQPHVLVPKVINEEPRSKLTGYQRLKEF